LAKKYLELFGMSLFRKICRKGSDLTQNAALDILSLPIYLWNNQDDYFPVGFAIAGAIVTSGIWVPLAMTSTALNKLSKG
jgi:hypothetical protein